VTADRLAVCQNPHGFHEHIELAPGDPAPATCFADCDCTPRVYVAADVEGTYLTTPKGAACLAPQKAD